MRQLPSSQHTQQTKGLLSSELTDKSVTDDRVVRRPLPG